MRAQLNWIILEIIPYYPPKPLTVSKHDVV